jgi:dCTP deaminase
MPRNPGKQAARFALRLAAPAAKFRVQRPGRSSSRPVPERMTPVNSPLPSHSSHAAPPAAGGTGLLVRQQLAALVEQGIIAASQPLDADQIQPASMDLRLGAAAYRVEASFLAGERATVASRLEDLRMHDPLDLTRPCRLERGCVYIIPLLEELRLPPHLSAKANPKSTTGRLDIFTRLIADHGTEFDRVPAGYRGPLYVEVVPRTFSIVVQQGTKLNQLRVVQGDVSFSDDSLAALHRAEPLVHLAGQPADAIISGGLWVTIDLQGTPDSDVVGYRARPHGLIDLSRVAHYDRAEFWEPVHRSKKNTIILDPDDFYILVSREEIRVPPDLAAEMVAYEPPIGEFRVHYAGFFDPGFGHGPGLRGTRGVLEVRSHEVPYLLEDGQIVARLVYERLLAPPDRLYGTGIGSSYQHQGLTLSKHFR